MSGSFAAAGAAFWLGLLTSVSPCPLASNIAAISYIGKGVANPIRVLAAGLLYTLGRVLAYALLGSLLVASLASVVGLSNTLQRYMNQILGPVLILAGMFLLELLNWRSSGGGFREGLQRRADRWGLWGAVALGGLFALSFCPVSAALFFGSLIPLTMKSGNSVTNTRTTFCRHAQRSALTVASTATARRPVSSLGRRLTGHSGKTSTWAQNYKILGLSSFGVHLGAFREQWLKPALYAFLAVAALLLAILALRWFLSGQTTLLGLKSAGIWRWLPLAGLLGLGVAAVTPGLLSYMTVERFRLDANHFWVALAVLSVSIWVTSIASPGRQRLVFALVALTSISGVLMVLRIEWVDALNRYAYTAFDLGLTALTALTSLIVAARLWRIGVESGG